MYCSTIGPIFQLFPQDTVLEPIGMLTSEAMTPGKYRISCIGPHNMES